MIETKPKANPNYEESAVRLTNPPEVEGLLRELQNQQTLTQQLRNQADALIPDELKEKIREGDENVNKFMALIRQAIDDFGSYQNPDLGWYALKQRRESITYKPELVREYAPVKVAEFVVVEAVDSKALDALAKAGQISPEQLRKCGEVRESYAYIIK